MGVILRLPLPLLPLPPLLWLVVVRSVVATLLPSRLESVVVIIRDDGTMSCTYCVERDVVDVEAVAGNMCEDERCADRFV